MLDDAKMPDVSKSNDYRLGIFHSHMNETGRTNKNVPIAFDPSTTSTTAHAVLTWDSCFFISNLVLAYNGVSKFSIFGEIVYVEVRARQR